MTAAPTTRIWVAGDCDGLADLYAQLGASGTIAVLGYSATLGDPAAIGAAQPDVVLLAARGAAVPHHELAALREHSAAPVVLLVSGASPALADETVGADLAELLLMPQTTESVVFALRRAHAAVRTAARSTGGGRVITVLSPKGGTGKSVIATNLAGVLAGRGEGSTLLVDLDLQFGDVAIMLGLEPATTLHDLVAAPVDVDADKLAGCATRHACGLEVLPAPLRPEDGELVADTRVGQLLDVARATYGTVVVDTSPYFNGPMLATLDRTDELLVVCAPDVPTLKNVRLALQTLTLLSFPPERVRVVLNRASAEALRAADVAAVLGRAVDFELPADQSVVVGVNRGTPTALLKPAAPFSQALRALADAVAAPRAAERPAPPARRFALGRI